MSSRDPSTDPAHPLSARSTPRDDRVVPGYVYMLRCSDDSFYVGSTTNLAARLHQHDIGRGAEYTRDRRPVELVWHEEYEKVSHAFARETQVQNWSRAKRLALIEGDYERLPALAKKDFSRRPRATREPPNPPEVVE